MKKITTIGLNTLKGFSAPVFNFTIAVLGIKFFGKDDWGIWINLMLWIAFVAFISNWGNREFVIRKYAGQPSQLYSIFYTNFFSRSLLLLPSILFFFFFSIQIAFYAMTLVILIYLFSSLDSLVVYHQKFGAQLIAEIIGFVVIIGGLWVLKKFDPLLVLQFFCLAYLLKNMILVFALNLFREKISFDFSLNEISDSVPFFLIGFSGWLQSKADIYLVSYFLPNSQLSEYQLLITAFLMLRAIAAFMLIPFTKHIFRLQPQNIKNLKRLLTYSALPIVAFGTFCIYIVLEKIVGLNIDWSIYILGGLSSLPYYFFAIDIMEFYKKKEEKKVMKLIFTGAFFNIFLIVLLIDKYQIHGVFMAICLTQLLMLFLYKNYTSTTVSKV